MTAQSEIEAEFMIAYFNLMAKHPCPDEVIELAKQRFQAVQKAEID
jgi:hypothetical protein